LNALEECRLKLYTSIKNTKSLLSPSVLQKSQRLDKLVIESMRHKGGFLRMISDCKECANKGTELCKICAETSGGRPTQFKQTETNEEA
jgi:hypothetical protein